MRVTENPMPSVMLKKNAEGKLVFYVPKKDLEEVAESVEFDSPDKWGGEVLLGDGSKYYFEPLDAQPDFPITLRAKRLDSGE
jgi:nitrogen fixation protein NifT